MSLFQCTRSFDIGGSLAKFAYVGEEIVIPRSESGSLQLSDNVVLELPTQKLHFVALPSSRVGQFCAYLHKVSPSNNTIVATGGGGLKYKEVIEKECGAREVPFVDEMKSLVMGLNLILSNKCFEGNAVFTYERKKKLYVKDHAKAFGESVFPYLFVNIGSGISIIQVSSESSFARVTGSCVGGATFLALGKLLGGMDIDFDTILDLASKGNPQNVDLMVKDVRGFEGEKYSGISEELIASSFGKVGLGAKLENLKREDLLASLVNMMGLNIAQIVAFTAATQNVKNIFISGGFIRKNRTVWKNMQWALKYYGQFVLSHQMNAFFVKHHKFLGCIGCLVDGGMTEKLEKEKKEKEEKEKKEKKDKEEKEKKEKEEKEKREKKDKEEKTLATSLKGVAEKKDDKPSKSVEKKEEKTTTSSPAIKQQ